MAAIWSRNFKRGAKLVILFVIICFCSSSLAADFQPSQGVIPVSDIHTLHKFVADSHHTPLCVLLCKNDSPLEKRVVKLWSSSRSDAHLQPLLSWKLAAVNVTEVKRLPGYLVQKSGEPKASLLRCFLGPTLSHDFHATNRKHAKLVQWFDWLVLQHEHLVNASVDTVEASVKHHRFTLVVFPTAEQHRQLEQTVFQIGKALSTGCRINILVIHPASANFRSILGMYHITSTPSVLLIEKDGEKDSEQTVLNIHDVMTGRLDTELRARLVPAQRLAMDSFHTQVLKADGATAYHPMLVGFYAHWAKHTAVFLSMMKTTVEEFRSLNADMRFGLVDASRHPEVVSRYMSPTCLGHLPFLAVFHTEEGSSVVNKTELLLTRPSPFTVYVALLEAGLPLKDTNQWPILYNPYGNNNRMSLPREGPGGDICSADNVTHLSVNEELLASLQNLDVKDSEQDEKKPKIPLATFDDFADDTNHNDTFVVKVFIFIQHPCRSCEQSLPAFESVYEHYMTTNDQHAVRLVNCSESWQICQEHHVTGFPTILALRSFTASSQCADSCSSGDAPCATTVRQQYHGVLTAPSIMAWVDSLSIPAVRSLRFDQPVWKPEESVHLLATVIPLQSSYLPRAPGGSRDYFYNVQCLRLACERLFGLARCFTAYSTQVPASQFANLTEENFVVMQVVFQRKDGVTKRLMELGQPLVEVLDAGMETDSHLFYHHYSYKLSAKQKCEDSHAKCTQFLEAFTRDHLRLPVTALTSGIIHSHSSLLFEKPIPVLLALIEPEGSESFLKTLTAVAYDLYKDVVVATLDVTEYAAWSGRFVPYKYTIRQSEKSDWGEMGVYPRLCMFYWYDHTRAAFFPPPSSPTTALDEREELLSHHSIVQFLHGFLEQPDKYLVETERF